jgi:hypothetical protein
MLCAELRRAKQEFVDAMANPFIAVRITPELDAAIAERMKETGQSKSDIVIEALKSYLGIQPFTKRLTDIEQRLASLEIFAESVEIPLNPHRPDTPHPPPHSV